MRLMLDSTTPAVLPTDVALVAGYIDGKYAWSKDDWARFPHAAQVRINVTGEHGRGTCLDVETGDATSASAPGWYDSVTWCDSYNRAIYCNRSTAAAVIAAMGKRDFRLWVATLDGSMPQTIDGRRVDAVQFAGASMIGWNADATVVWNNSWHS